MIHESIISTKIQAGTILNTLQEAVLVDPNDKNIIIIAILIPNRSV